MTSFTRNTDADLLWRCIACLQVKDPGHVITMPDNTTHYLCEACAAGLLRGLFKGLDMQRADLFKGVDKEDLTERAKRKNESFSMRYSEKLTALVDVHTEALFAAARAVCAACAHGDSPSRISTDSAGNPLGAYHTEGVRETAHEVACAAWPIRKLMSFRFAMGALPPPGGGDR